MVAKLDVLFYIIKKNILERLIVTLLVLKKQAFEKAIVVIKGLHFKAVGLNDLPLYFQFPAAFRTQFVRPKKQRAKGVLFNLLVTIQTPHKWLLASLR